MTRDPINYVVTFDKFEDAFNFFFGPQQADAHVKQRNRYIRSAEMKARADFFDEQVKAKVKQYGGYMAWLKAEPAGGEHCEAMRREFDKRCES